MASKIYTICLGCGNVQVRTDIVTSFASAPFVILDRKGMCPKCRKVSQYAATKDIKELTKKLSNSDNKLDQRIKGFIRG